MNPDTQSLTAYVASFVATTRTAAIPPEVRAWESVVFWTDWVWPFVARSLQQAASFESI